MQRAIGQLEKWIGMVATLVRKCMIISIEH